VVTGTARLLSWFISGLVDYYLFLLVSHGSLRILIRRLSLVLGLCLVLVSSSLLLLILLEPRVEQDHTVVHNLEVLGEEASIIAELVEEHGNLLLFNLNYE
jgi:hypothetical protein